MVAPDPQTPRPGGIGLRGAGEGGVRRRKAQRHRAVLPVEALEDRCLLSTLDIDGGVLLWSAEAPAASSLTVSIDPSNPGNVVFTDSGQSISLGVGAIGSGWSAVSANVVTGPLSAYSTMEVDGDTTAGQTLTVDYTNGDPVPNAGVDFNPTAATGFLANSLVMLGGTTFTSETYAMNGPGAGTITYSDSTQNGVQIAFTNLTPITDTVPSASFTFNAPGNAMIVNVNTGPSLGVQTDQINDGGTGQFELVNFANKTAVNVNVPAATTTINLVALATGLSTLNVLSGSGGSTVNVQAVPAGIAVHVDTGSAPGSTTNVTLFGSLAAIRSPVFVQSTGGANTLAVDDSSEGSGHTYTIAGSRITADNFATFIDFSGGGIGTVDLTTAGRGDVFNFTGPAQSTVSFFHFSASAGAGPNTLNVTSNVPTLSFATAGELGFGAGNPIIDYTNFQTINVTKPAAPPVGSSASFSAAFGQPLSNVVVASFIEDDLGNTAGDYAATIDWGDSSTSPGTFQLTGPNRYNVLGSHTYTASGTFTITVTLTDLGSTGSTVVGVTAIHVTSTGPVPSTPDPIISTADIAVSTLTAQGATVAGREGTPLNPVAGEGVLVATFVDNGVLGSIGDYSATIDWGDGDTTAPTRITSQGTPNGVVFSVFGNHSYADEGTDAVNVTITRVDTGATAIASGQAVIGDSALTPATAAALSANTGRALSAASIIGSFTDANTLAPAGDFTATIDWGDGSPNSIGFVVDDTTAGSFNVLGTHIYAKPGVYAPSIVVRDVGGSTVTLVSEDTAAITVSDAAVTGSTKSFTAVEGIDTGTFVLATFTDPNTLATVADVTASLAAGGWGDGTPLAATGPGSLVVQQIGVTPLTSPTNPGAPIFEVLGRHTYAAETPTGTTDTLKVVITTLGGATTTLTSSPLGGVTVLDAPLSSSNGTVITGFEGSPTDGPAAGTLLGTFTDANQGASAAEFTTTPGVVTVDWGDGSLPQTLLTSNLNALGSPNGVIFRVNAAHIYAEAGTYAYTVLVKDVGGAVTMISGSAVIRDAGIAASAAQPTISTTEAAVFPVPQFSPPVFSGAVAAFTDGNIAALPSDFTATIDWGDGTPLTAGVVSHPVGIAPGNFLVRGSHTFADSSANGGNGSYQVQVFVQDVDGSRVTVTNTASVADHPIILAGQLNPLSDSGVSDTDGITNIKQPNFFGVSEPFSHVTLFATAAGGAGTPIGQVQADGNGAWNLSSNVPLADGSYRITASAVDQFGVTKTTAPTAIAPNLVIDTVGPKVTGVSFDRLDGQIVATFQDYGGANNGGAGINGSSLIDANNYRFVTQRHPVVGKFQVSQIVDTPGTTSGPQTATLSINDGRYIKGGSYVFTIRSASPDNPSGIRDIAGNALDGEFYSFFPSGNNVNGGSFATRITAIHHATFAPATIVGRATPVSPPGTQHGIVHDPRTIVPTKLSHAVSSARVRISRQAAAKAVHSASPALTARTQADSTSVPTMAAISPPGLMTAISPVGAVDQVLEQIGATKR